MAQTQGRHAELKRAKPGKAIQIEQQRKALNKRGAQSTQKSATKEKQESATAAYATFVAKRPRTRHRQREITKRHPGSLEAKQKHATGRRRKTQPHTKVGNEKLGREKFFSYQPIVPGQVEGFLNKTYTQLGQLLATQTRLGAVASA